MNETLRGRVLAADREEAMDAACARAAEWFGSAEVSVRLTSAEVETERYGYGQVSRTVFRFSAEFEATIKENQ